MPSKNPPQFHIDLIGMKTIWILYSGSRIPKCLDLVYCVIFIFDKILYCIFNLSTGISQNIVLASHTLCVRFSLFLKKSVHTITWDLSLWKFVSQCVYIIKYLFKLYFDEHTYICSGHGDSNGKSLPSLVQDISGVGQVSCGSSHTLVLSQDGRTVWSFGGGDNGNYLHYYTLKFCVCIDVCHAWITSNADSYNVGVYGMYAFSLPPCAFSVVSIST